MLTVLTYPPDFQVDAVLCDSAVTADGKLYIQGGGWNLLGAESFPFRQSRIGIGVILQVPYTQTNRDHELRIALRHEDEDPTGDGGDEVGGIVRFNLGRPAILQPGEPQHVPFALNLDQIPFERPGTYSFVITIDGEELGRLTFRVFGPPAFKASG
jgi:hypothetical protein